MTLEELLEESFPHTSFMVNSEFSFDIEENTVYFPLQDNGSIWGKLFYDNFISRYPLAINYSVYLLSLLHEVGHSETLSEMEDDTLVRLFCRTLDDEESAPIYFNLHNEWIATNWAIGKLRQETEKMTRLDRKLQEILMKKGL